MKSYLEGEIQPVESISIVSILFRQFLSQCQGRSVKFHWENDNCINDNIIKIFNFSWNQRNWKFMTFQL